MRAPTTQCRQLRRGLLASPCCFIPQWQTAACLASCLPALQSSLVFGLLQQAQAAQEAVLRRGAEAGYTPASGLISIPLHQAAAAIGGAPPGAPDPHLPLYAPSPAAAGQQLLAQQGPAAQLQPPPARPPLPIRPAMQPPPAAPAPEPAAPQLPSMQQQREAVTMRPLYAGPRPPHLVRVHCCCCRALGEPPPPPWPSLGDVPH